MKITLLMKSAVAAGALALTGTAFAIPRATVAHPVAATLSTAANVSFNDVIQFTVLSNIKSLSVVVVGQWVGDTSKKITSFQGTLTGPSGFSKTLTLSTVPITAPIGGHPVVIGGIQTLSETSAITAKGTYTLTFTGTTKVAEQLKYTITAVPEPETYALMLAGLGGLAFIARRRKNV